MLLEFVVPLLIKKIHEGGPFFGKSNATHHPISWVLVLFVVQAPTKKGVTFWGAQNSRSHTSFSAVVAFWGIEDENTFYNHATCLKFIWCGCYFNFSADQLVVVVIVLRLLVFHDKPQPLPLLMGRTWVTMIAFVESYWNFSHFFEMKNVFENMKCNAYTWKIWLT